MDQVVVVAAIASGIRFAMPILFAALGETVSEKAGVLNVGIEGIMLIGAFLAVLISVQTGSPWVGLLAAIAGGIALGLLHGWMVVVLKVDQIVSGIALVVLGAGLSGFGYRLALDGGAVRVPGFRQLDLGLLSHLPVVGPVLFSQHFLAYVGIALAFALGFMLRRTGLGLTIRAVGETPEAAAAAGIEIDRVRLCCAAFGGSLAGIGGAFLSTAQLAGFVENMVSGRGFIALACVVFSRWRPVGALFAALAFGIADAAQVRMQALYPDIPYQAFIILPFVIALLAMTMPGGAARGPAQLGRPFRRG
ncbi:ABC transporter permease [Pseudaminobacter soli (ex Li et al. 2025)]|nr:ABC transporter permease [Mesorhizobium soli]